MDVGCAPSIGWRTWYALPPSGALAEATIEELETWCVRRLSRLKTMELAEVEMVEDAISFQMLCLAASGSADACETWAAWTRVEGRQLSGWVQRLRDQRDTDGVATFLSSAPAVFAGVRMEEGGYALTTAELAAAYVASDSEVAIKVPFEDVADIVAKRECLLDEGDAIALVDSLPQFVSSVFVRHVDIKLASCRRLARMLRASDDRLDRLLSFLSQQLGEMTLLLSSAMRRGYNRAALSGPAMTLERLERAWKTDLPLCGVAIHHQLLARNHLKYFDRIQHALLLKGAGLSWEDILQLYSKHFLRVMTSDQYRKKRYEYEIRHLFALEGSRIDREPFTCQDLIDEHSRATGNCNGCTYKCADEGSLHSLLGLRNHSAEDIEDIIKHVDSGDYRLACHRELQLSTRRRPVNRVDHAPSQSQSQPSQPPHQIMPDLDKETFMTPAGYVNLSCAFSLSDDAYM